MIPGNQTLSDNLGWKGQEQLKRQVGKSWLEETVEG